LRKPETPASELAPREGLAEARGNTEPVQQAARE
jgi:hypothetical protein